MKVFILEYRTDKNSLISKAIRFFTRRSYTHSAIFINNHFCELDAIDEYSGEPDYHVVKHRSLYDVLKVNRRIEAYQVPKEFSEKECSAGINFFKRKEIQNVKYGYTKLFRYAYLSKIKRFLKWYYKKYGKPYMPAGDHDGYDVCSEAVGICSKKYMNWWITEISDKYKYLIPETTYPGIYAEVLKDYKVEV